MTKGRVGEGVAAEHLASRGYRVVVRNFRSHLGEIDIVAEKDRSLVFVEVKTWDYHGSESLEWSIDWRKQRRIIGGSRDFLMRHPEYDDYKKRYDVILVSGQLGHVEHLEAAFEG